MRDATLEIGNWKPVLDAQCIEHCLIQVRGVHHADANFMSGSVTVHYDESQVAIGDLKQMLNRKSTKRTRENFVGVEEKTK